MVLSCLTQKRKGGTGLHDIFHNTHRFHTVHTLPSAHRHLRIWCAVHRPKPLLRQRFFLLRGFSSFSSEYQDAIASSRCLKKKALAPKGGEKKKNSKYPTEIWFYSCRASFQYLSVRTAALCSRTDWHARWSTFTWPAIELGVFILEPHEDCLSAQQEVESVSQ